MKKILIIEDDELIAGLYRTQLQREGFSVEVAHDGETALSRLTDLAPDALLLDLMLPGISGLDLIRRVRAQEPFQKLPIVVLSNSFVPTLFQKAQEAGATKVFNKASARPAELVAAVKALCPPHLERPPAAPSGLPGSPLAATGGDPATAGPGGFETEIALNFQSELRHRFILEMPVRLAAMRHLFQDAARSAPGAVLLPKLQELRHLIHLLTGRAVLAGLDRATQVCSALEALLQDLHDKPKYINASSLRTVAQTLDLLDLLAQDAAVSPDEPVRPVLILVVDDDVISRQTIRSALEKVNLRCVRVADAESAIGLCQENHFDLILSDVDMPGMNGFQMCQQIRTLPANTTAPFILVTGLSDFEARTRSILSGGNDLIGKPFLLIELAVKALSHVLKSQLLAR